ncbi:acyltransferase family protein [Saccharopolyspora sp. 5N102]|uniref:acyltransferase family protein n=1 Tax=Saccharopolyspora sp. 5N102 TaxID=3375155 RepID=UPI0037AFA8C0
MRFVAALLVFLEHGSYVNGFETGGFSAAYRAVFTNGGATGVSFFFVLSGFILTVSAFPGDSPLRFWRRRAVKIYPNHLVVFVPWLALLAGAAAAGYQAYPTPDRLVPAALLLQAWIPDYAVMTAGNPVTWTLSCEVAFYAAFPFLLGLVRRIRPGRLWWWVAGTGCAVLAVVALASLALPAEPRISPEVPVGLHQYWLVNHLPITRGLEFALGMLLARIVQEGRWPAFLTLPRAMLLVVSCYAAAAWLPYLWTRTGILPVPLGMVIGAAAVADLRNRWSPLRGRAFQWLGETSYAFYLVHFAVLILVLPAAGGRLGDLLGIAVLALSLLVALAVAGVLHGAVERPLVRRWSRSAPPRSA